MPPKVYPLPAEFAKFDRFMFDMGFRRITKIEFVKDFNRLGLVAPSPRKGREVGYEFHANGLTAKVWSSWIAAEENIRHEDSGWILIVQGDDAVYFAPPLHRTKNFLRNLALYAWIVRWRVLNRPLCVECKQYMEITRGRGLKQRYWSCSRKKFHQSGKYIFASWDIGMPPRAKRFLEARRRARAREKAKNLQEGKVVTPAILKRIGWSRIDPSRAG